MVRMITVNKKAFTRKDGVRVKASTFKIRDRGKPGRGPRIIPPLVKGSLGVDFSKPRMVRRRIEVALAKKIGERKVMGKLRAIQVFNKNTNPTLSEKARSDAKFIASSFIGRKRVRTGTGLSRR